MSLYNPPPPTIVSYREGNVADFDANPATGTFSTNPHNINDGNTGTNAISNAIDQYAIVDIGKVVELTQWRQYGHVSNNGDGEWRLDYYDLESHSWKAFASGIATRGTADWSTFAVVAAVKTDKIRIWDVIKDTGVSGSIISELEVIY